MMGTYFFIPELCSCTNNKVSLVHSFPGRKKARPHSALVVRVDLRRADMIRAIMSKTGLNEGTL